MGTAQAKEAMSRSLLISVVLALFMAVSASEGKKASGPKQFPSNWGSPPEIQTMDIRPLAGGYGHGSSTLNNWIMKSMDADKEKEAVQYPPAFGEPPRAQTRDLRPLPFHYGMGSGTMANWLAENAKAIYGEDAKEYD